MIAMRRMLMLLVLVSLAGCENRPSAGMKQAGPGASPAPVGDADPPPGVIKAEDATGIWSQDQVRQYITEELRLSSVTLTPSGGGNYTAQGQTAEGAQYDITIEQKPGGIRYEWTNSNGQQGNGAFGTFVETSSN